MVLGGDVVVIDFLKTVVQQKCPGPTVMHFFFFTVGILLLWYCNLSNLSCSLVFHESYKHLTRSAKCCKYYYYRCIETQTVCRCHLFYVKSGKRQTFLKNNNKKNSFSDVLLIHIHLAAKFLLPHKWNGHAAIFRSQLFCPGSAWSNSLNTFAKTRLPQHSAWIADQLSSCPPSCAAILNRYRIHWPSRCLMPC